MGYPNVQHYQDMAKRKGVASHVTFTGKVMYKNAPALLSVGDIAVAPKMSTTEGSGKVLNYMALAQPVVAYDSPVHREYLDKWGVYAPLGDVNCLTEEIRSLLHNPERRKYLGQKLRERAVTHYSWGQAGKKIESVYEDLTG